MEDLKSLMSCLDEISSKIGDGMYLQMADKLKNIHNELNGNKPFHEDTFYYSDDDSDSDSDSDYEVQIRETVERGRAVARATREAADPERTRRIEQARAKILQIVRSTRQRVQTPQEVGKDGGRPRPSYEAHDCVTEEPGYSEMVRKKRGSVPQWYCWGSYWMWSHHHWVYLLELEKPDGKRSSCDRGGNWN